MLSISRRRRAALARPRRLSAPLRYLLVESLEPRWMLASELFASGIDSYWVDPDVYDDGAILVRFSDGAMSVSNAESVDLSGILPGGRAVGLLDSLPGLQRIELPAGVHVEQALSAFRASPDVLYAEPNYRLRTSLIPNDLRYNEMWALENLGQTGGVVDADVDASGAWDVNTGSGSMLVAVIDTGVNYLHSDLADNIWINSDELPGDGIDNDGNGYVDDLHGYDFVNRDGDPMDDQGHGTHVAGTIGAVGNNGLGVTGLNWNVQIMALKFLGADGSGTGADAIEALNYAVANGARLSNNSWGGDPYSQAMYDAIAAARSAGHLFVAAAGNGNMFGIGQNNDVNAFFPSGYELDNVLAVAAVDHQDQLAPFSNYGATTVDLAAPGVNILSTTSNGGYGVSSGTSMAAPHVAGAAALVWDTHPDWTYQQVVSKLMSSVDVLPGLQGLVASGGRLNLATALDNQQPGPPPPPPGSLPLIEDFQDGKADYLDARSGKWAVTGGRYRVEPAVSDSQLATVATWRLDEALPTNFELQATVNAEEGRLELFGIVFRDFSTNGFLIFDYQDQQNFKFAGADMDQDRWVIGHRDASGWHADASLPSLLSAATNYRLKLSVQDGNQVELRVADETVLTHVFSQAVNAGLAGVGTRNGVATFDDVVARAYHPVVPGSLPHTDDFQDGVADHLHEPKGIATVSDGRLQLEPLGGGDALVTLEVAEPLPTEVRILATMNAQAAGGGKLSNGFVIFDYQSATDFKFAGAFVGIDQWLIGRRTAQDWVADAILDANLHSGIDYQLQVTLEADGTVSLAANGIPQVSYQYGDALTDGPLGLGTKNARTIFDDLSVSAYAPPPRSDLPFAEDFADETAEFLENRAGVWTIASERYTVTPAMGADGISLVRLKLLPADSQVQATLNMGNASTGRLTNGFLIFDYQHATNFKFAGAYAGSDQWLIGHRDATGWVLDSTLSQVIDTGADYHLRLEVTDDTQVTLFVDGIPKLTRTYNESLRDGDVGIGSRNAIATFDDLAVQDGGGQGPVPGVLPLVEDFQDGVADHLLLASGLAGVSDGQYHVVPHPDSDGISTILLAEPLPARVRLEGTINVDPAVSGRLSNAFLVFDYVSPTNFKFAGAYAGSDQWLIGHRNASDWITDAFVDAAIQSEQDYHLELIVDGSSAQLLVDGIPQVQFDFGEDLSDGRLALGTKNALARFDNLSVNEYLPPPTTQVPFQENFEDGVGDFLAVQSGLWASSNQRYEVTPALNADGVSTILLASVPADLEILATVSATAASGGRLSNAFVIFDYQGPSDFKFAGAYAGSDQWLIGHRDSSDWHVDAAVGGLIDADTEYELRATLTSSSLVTLYVDGVPRMSHQFAGVLNDGSVGVGTRNAVSHFDDLAVAALDVSTPPPGSLPLLEDFDDSAADHLWIRSGSAGTGQGKYHVTPALNGDGISTVVLADPLPGNVQMQVTMNADPANGSRLSNAFLIFDYSGPTDFKFAGAYVGIDQWLIGHRSAAGWVTDAYVQGNLDPLTDYTLRVTLETDGTATLFVGGAEQVSFAFGESLTDGELGLGTLNALSRFDQFSVSSHPKAALPFNENFADGQIEFAEARRGQWTVSGQQYHVLPAAGGDGVSTLRLQSLPGDFEILATIQADPAAVNRLSNAFVIFDYHGPTNFHFAGAHAGSDEWLVGRRTSSGWILDSSVSEPIEVWTNYDLRVTVTHDTQVTLYVDGVAKVSRTYGNSLSDGDVGVGTRNAISRFDDLTVRPLSSPQVLWFQEPIEPLRVFELPQRLSPRDDSVQTRISAASPAAHAAPADLADLAKLAASQLALGGWLSTSTWSPSYEAPEPPESLEGPGVAMSRKIGLTSRDVRIRLAGSEIREGVAPERQDLPEHGTLENARELAHDEALKRWPWSVEECCDRELGRDNLDRSLDGS